MRRYVSPLARASSASSTAFIILARPCAAGLGCQQQPSVARSLSRHTDWVRQRINWEKTTQTATCEAEELTDWGTAAKSPLRVYYYLFISLSIQYYCIWDWDKTASKKIQCIYIYIYTAVYVCCMGEIRRHGNLPSVSWKGEEMLGKERSIVPFRAPPSSF